MKLFTCTACNQVVFFENVACMKCGHALAYLPDRGIVSAIEPAPPPPAGSPGAAAGLATYVALAPDAGGGLYKLCKNSIDYEACNWAIPADSADAYCASCALNDVVPNLADAAAKEAWVRLERAKRRLLYGLSGLGLPIEPKSANPRGLAFSFKQDVANEKVFTGHSDGLITINVAEADDPFREKMRKEMGETYRTLLGHFRHEIGHYYWDRLVSDTGEIARFRALFGDETRDYGDALKHHYDNGPPQDWAQRFVSAYASMHPWEDFAETWAHYLHIVDTLETARTYGLALKPKAVGGGTLETVAARRVQTGDFDDIFAAWVPLTVALNSLNRGMGLLDLYPFVLPEPALAKLRFVHELVEKAALAAPASPGADPHAMPLAQATSIIPPTLRDGAMSERQAS